MTSLGQLGIRAVIGGGHAGRERGGLGEEIGVIHRVLGDFDGSVRAEGMRCTGSGAFDFLDITGTTAAHPVGRQ
ncbi:hypothetical protein GCM10010425_68720 [Streptomyces spororaveus]|uniref:Uncharacterized protein n=1 Tax=Streptomyces spororaveus TaxID=284039 RepID=A0ABQ3T454_9ACTN|nr:hypothetical protein Sspor_03360 [Streptomyces spororaveus]